MRTRVALVAFAAGLLAISGCSDDSSARQRGQSEASSQTDASSADGSNAVGSDAAGSNESKARDTAARKAADLAAAKEASRIPSGVAGEPAPNDDDGARNSIVTDAKHAPEPQNGSGSVAKDPLVAPTPTSPAPSRPDTSGLRPLDGCDEISDPFYRAASSLNPNSASDDLRAGVADYTKVAALADPSIAGAANTLLSVAKAASADAARASDFAGSAYQGAIVAVHTYLGDACGR